MQHKYNIGYSYRELIKQNKDEVNYMDGMSIRSLPACFSCCCSNKPPVVSCLRDNMLVLPLVNCFSVLVVGGISCVHQACCIGPHRGGLNHQCCSAFWLLEKNCFSRPLINLTDSWCAVTTTVKNILWPMQLWIFPVRGPNLQNVW